MEPWAEFGEAERYYGHPQYAGDDEDEGGGMEDEMRTAHDLLASASAAALADPQVGVPEPLVQAERLGRLQEAGFTLAEGRALIGVLAEVQAEAAKAYAGYVLAWLDNHRGA